jgi:heme/copper-type cytochrome/quinol oxidase subunit 1
MIEGSALRDTYHVVRHVRYFLWLVLAIPLIWLLWYPVPKLRNDWRRGRTFSMIVFLIGSALLAAPMAMIAIPGMIPARYALATTLAALLLAVLRHRRHWEALAALPGWP